MSEIETNVMQRLYKDISKQHNVPIERIMLAITDNGMYFQAYITNEAETDLIYVCDTLVPTANSTPSDEEIDSAIWEGVDKDYSYDRNTDEEIVTDHFDSYQAREAIKRLLNRHN